MFCFWITVAGWWAWNAFLSGIYAPAPSPYAVRDGFTTTFGRDATWWLSLVVALMALSTAEIAYRTTKHAVVTAGLWRFPTWMQRYGLGHPRQKLRASPFGGSGTSVVGMGGGGEMAEEMAVETWQEMEKDPAVAEGLRMMCMDFEGDSYNEDDDDGARREANNGSGAEQARSTRIPNWPTFLSRGRGSTGPGEK